ncbi:hypothetical protein MLPM_0217 [Mycobacterium lepromatosis]|uniref:Uncharacterized protein n=1 Tax=Mycobacterium lepromatosis TaxID=480418 RepID=A0A0F4ESI0_9MYCO|nr:hypothetical protein MLPM_0217 [Mycobacterium lepromatosis]
MSLSRLVLYPAGLRTVRSDLQRSLAGGDLEWVKELGRGARS